MEHKVTLGENKFVRIPNRFTAGEKNVLAFESSTYTLDGLNVIITDGKVTKRFLLEGTKLDITEYCKQACVVEINVDLIYLGKIAKTWKLEPLVVMEIEDVFEVIPEIVLMRQEIATMKQIIKELNTKINETM